MKATDEGEPVRAAGAARALSAEADVAVFYRFIEAVAQGASAPAMVQFLAEGFVEHGAGPDRDAASLANGLAGRRRRLGDAEWLIERLAGIGGLVICDAVVSWKRGDGAGDRARETVVARVVAGRIAECWRVGDARLRFDAQPEGAAPCDTAGAAPAPP